MENLDQVLQYYEDITSYEDVDNDSILAYGTGIGKRIQRFFNCMEAFIFGQEVLLRRRSNKFLLRVVKVDEGSTLSIQNKIILISKVIIFCHETFGFAPGTLEKMLVEKVEEMKRSVIGQLR